MEDVYKEVVIDKSLLNGTVLYNSSYISLKLALMKYVVIIILLFSATIIISQEVDIKKNALSTTFFKLEANKQLIHYKLQPKFYTSLEYERLGERWSWSTSIEYAFSKINEDCKNCNDHYQGTGFLRDINIFTGVNYRLLEKNDSKFHLFVGGDVYYATTDYNGYFIGG